MNTTIKMFKRTGLAANLLSDMDLMEALEDVKAQLKTYETQVGRIEMELFKRMEDRGATSIPNANPDGEQVYICEQDETYTYDQTAFAPLREIFDTFAIKECYAPEYEKTVTVPGQWVTAKVKATAKKHGDEALAIVDRAKMLKSLTLKFHRVPRG